MVDPLGLEGMSWGGDGKRVLAGQKIGNYCGKERSNLVVQVTDKSKQIPHLVAGGLAIVAAGIPWIWQSVFEECSSSAWLCLGLPLVPCLAFAGWLFATSHGLGKAIALISLCIALIPNWEILAMFLAWSISGFGP